MSLSTGIVRIQTKTQIGETHNKELGTGFVVTSSGIVFTCKHVLKYYSPEFIEDSYLVVFNNKINN